MPAARSQPALIALPKRNRKSPEPHRNPCRRGKELCQRERVARLPPRHGTHLGGEDYVCRHVTNLNRLASQLRCRSFLLGTVAGAENLLLKSSELCGEICNLQFSQTVARWYLTPQQYIMSPLLVYSKTARIQSGSALETNNVSADTDFREPKLPDEGNFDSHNLIIVPSPAPNLVTGLDSKSGGC